MNYGSLFVISSSHTKIRVVPKTQAFVASFASDNQQLYWVKARSFVGPERYEAIPVASPVLPASIFDDPLSYLRMLSKLHDESWSQIRLFGTFF